MTLREEAVLVRVFVSEDARFDGRPAWHAALTHLRLSGFRGATVFRARAGFSGDVEVAGRLEVPAGGFPIVVEAVERAEAVGHVVEDLEAILGEAGLVTVERVEAIEVGGPEKGAA